jgi:hypothetical protein
MRGGMQGSGTRRATRALFGTVLLAMGATPGCGQSTHRTPTPTLTPIPPVDLAGEPAKSGSRLRAVYWVSEEGLRVPTARFLDTQRDEECSFGTSSRDSLYCYPDAVSGPRGLPLYDADCRTPVFADCLDYAIPEDTATCETPTRSLYTLGSAIDGKPLSTLSCSPSPDDVPGTRYRRLGARVPDSEFVRAVAGVASGNGERLGFEQLSAEDGSAVVLDFFDQLEGVACGDFWVSPDDPHYCAPAWQGYVDTYFDDDRCQGDGRRLMVGECPTEIGYSIREQLFYRIGRSFGPLPPFVRREGLPEDCSPTFPAPSAFELGEALPLTAFETLEAVRVGEGRVKLGIRRSSDGQVVLPTTLGGSTTYLWDDELSVTCGIRTTSDGEYRCVPLLDGHYAPGLYADERCEVPVAAGRGELADGEPHWLVTFPEPSAHGCPPPSRTVVYELADEPLAGNAFVPSKDQDGNPTCVDAGPFPQPLFALEGEVAPSRFVRFEKQVE